MGKKRDFTLVESKLMDSEWELEHEGGKFLVEFRADAYNHFICNDFPDHSHYRVEGGEGDKPMVYLSWGKYGEYEFTILPGDDGKWETMTGHAKGDPKNWRKLKRLATLVPGQEDAHAHEHGH